MVLTTTKLEVNCSVEKLWAMMVEKMRRPDKYVPGVTEVKVVREFGPLSIEREMIVENDGEKTVVRELITGDEATKSVIFKLKDNPYFTGFVSNMIFENEESVELDYTAHWTRRNPSSDIPFPPLENLIQNAVEHAKALAEK